MQIVQIFALRLAVQESRDTDVQSLKLLAPKSRDKGA